jgi:hypothetical protein
MKEEEESDRNARGDPEDLGAAPLDGKRRRQDDGQGKRDREGVGAKLNKQRRAPEEGVR